MNDFLSHLAARTLGLGEVVRPRVSAIFEPLPAPVPPRTEMRDGLAHFAEEEDDGLDAPPAATQDVTRSVERRLLTSSGRDGSEGERVTAIVPATSEPPARPIERAAGRPRGSAVPPIIQAPRPSPGSGPPTIRAGDAGTIRRSSERSAQAALALVPNGTDFSEHLSSRAASEARQPVIGHWRPLRDPKGADASGRPAVSPVVEEDDEAPAPAAAGDPTARRHDVLPLLPPSVTDASLRSGPAAPSARPARVRDGASRDRTVPRAAWRGPLRPLNEDLRGSFASGPFDSTRGDPIPPRDPDTAGAARIVVQPRVGIYSEPAGPARSQPAVRAEPTIQVTIGRVEVRATPPAAPVSRSGRQTPPTMSLDEYLRRRAAGSPR